MKNSTLSWIFISALLLFGVIFISHVQPAKGAVTHIVISQIQIAGTNGADDEFVELYNPTASDVPLTKWRLDKETPSGTGSANLVASMSGTIKSHGFFLVTSHVSSASGSADLLYSNNSNSIASNNTVVLFSDAGTTRVDTVGMGTATDKETADTQNPTSGESIQRKTDDTGGPGVDTDNNLNDFTLLALSNPHNSSVVITPTVTPSTTPIPTVTPTLTPTVTPSNTPTPTVLPTATPTVTPIPTVTPTPTSIETPTPTVSPTPTVTSSPTPTPSPTPTMTPTPTVTTSITPTMSITPTISLTPTPINPFPHLVCTTHLVSFHILFINIQIPTLSCSFVN